MYIKYQLWYAVFWFQADMLDMENMEMVDSVFSDPSLWEVLVLDCTLKDGASVTTLNQLRGIETGGSVDTIDGINDTLEDIDQPTAGGSEDTLDGFNDTLEEIDQSESSTVQKECSCSNLDDTCQNGQPSLDMRKADDKGKYIKQQADAITTKGKPIDTKTKDFYVNDKDNLENGFLGTSNSRDKGNIGDNGGSDKSALVMKTDNSCETLVEFEMKETSKEIHGCNLTEDRVTLGGTTLDKEIDQVEKTCVNNNVPYHSSEVVNPKKKEDNLTAEEARAIPESSNSMVAAVTQHFECHSGSSTKGTSVEEELTEADNRGADCAGEMASDSRSPAQEQLTTKEPQPSTSGISYYAKPLSSKKRQERATYVKKMIDLFNTGVDQNTEKK